MESKTKTKTVSNRKTKGVAVCISTENNVVIIQGLTEKEKLDKQNSIGIVVSPTPRRISRSPLTPSTTTRKRAAPKCIEESPNVLIELTPILKDYINQIY